MKNYKFDFTTKTLTITKAFADEAEIPTTEEYAILMYSLLEKDGAHANIL